MLDPRLGLVERTIAPFSPDGACSIHWHLHGSRVAEFLHDICNPHISLHVAETSDSGFGFVAVEDLGYFLEGRASGFDVEPCDNREFEGNPAAVNGQEFPCWLHVFQSDWIDVPAGTSVFDPALCQVSEPTG